ncbi:CapA family protein [Carboxylicivirga caseinilyticus]|uniref:CapA family protein n=1 Tax=Carboxylicivirga caseinilyticus TaxID=3417572 RepID=UPI003D329BE3|nr:CapA family protein [Marinilabiliaceae bacterium A049]
MRSILILFFLVSITLNAQQKIQLLFLGDVMGHDSQINSARINETGEYDYYSCFQYIKDDIKAADIAIANLEVTLAGPPHKGYPQFSSPDTLADALVDAGVDALVMANNHCIDRRRQGLERSIQILDTKEIPRTGVFKDSIDRIVHNPLIIEKKGFRLAILNYTYGTNGIKVTPPNIVNYIDTALMSKDIALAKTMEVDKAIVFLHWGWEYNLSPNSEQKQLTQFLWQKGIDIIIGSHPHVVQPMKWVKNENQNQLVVYSLGNFISNQRTAPRDGGVMAMVELTKEGDSTYISNADYQLTWVHTPIENGKKKFYVLPADRYKNAYWPDTTARERMNEYIKEAGQVFKNNINIPKRNFQIPLLAIKRKEIDTVQIKAPKKI